MQSVSELVKEGFYFAQCQQRRLFFCRLSQVKYDADVRTVVVACLVNELLVEVRHPGSALLARAWEEVCIEDSEEAAVVVKDLISFHIGMIDFNLRLKAERNPVELCCQTEDAVLDVLKFEVGAEHFAVDVVLAQL